MNDNYTIEVRFGGSELTPAKLRSADLAYVITAVEQMLAAIVARDNPGLDIEEKQVTIGLSQITRGSIGLQFVSQYETQVRRAYDKATSAIAANNFDELPYRSVDALKKVIRFTRDHGTETVFGRQTGRFTPVATVTPSTEVQTSVREISGQSTLFGFLISVGGDRPPAATLRLLTGETFRCNVNEKSGLAVARELGRRLYTDVAVRGVGRWNTQDGALTFFPHRRIAWL